MDTKLESSPFPPGCVSASTKGAASPLAAVDERDRLAAEATAEGLRGLALAWLAIAFSLLASVGFADNPSDRTWMVILGVLALLAALIGFAYWWVVPAPPAMLQDQAHLGEQLQSAVALLNEARVFTRAGLIVAAVVGLIAVWLSDEPTDSKVVLTVAWVVGGGIAAWWATTRAVFTYVPAEAVSPEVTVLFNGRFTLSSLCRLSRLMKHCRDLDAPLIQERRSLVLSAMRTPDRKEQELVFTRALAVQHYRSDLMGVHDSPRLSAERLAKFSYARLERVKRRSLVLKAWWQILLTSKNNVILWMSIRSALGTMRTDLAKWQRHGLDKYLLSVRLTVCLTGDDKQIRKLMDLASSDLPDDAKVDSIIGALDDAINTTSRKESVVLEHRLEQLCGYRTATPAAERAS